MTHKSSAKQWGAGFLCLMLSVIVGCSSTKVPRRTVSKEEQAQIARLRASKEKADAARLQRYFTMEKEAPLPDKFKDSEDLAKVPLMVLKPEVEKIDGEDSEDEEFSKRHTIASSNFESMTFYQQGVEQMKVGRWDPAISAFTTFLRQTPEHVYADRAQFLIGECYFQNREYGLAVVAFNLVVSQYPHSVKVPEAMYRAALSHVEMGHTRPAQGLLRDLLRQYPADSIVSSASRKLAEISKPNRG